jgi:hypothetical protein
MKLVILSLFVLETTLNFLTPNLDVHQRLEPSLTSDEALLAGVQVEVVEGVVDGLDLAHLDEPHLQTTFIIKLLICHRSKESKIEKINVQK